VVRKEQWSHQHWGGGAGILTPGVKPLLRAVVKSVGKPKGSLRVTVQPRDPTLQRLPVCSGFIS
jgi:hypothetical protein